MSSVEAVISSAFQGYQMLLIAELSTLLINLILRSVGGGFCRSNTTLEVKITLLPFL